jgi:RNA polymerase sigma factor (sigma-70 family)
MPQAPISGKLGLTIVQSITNRQASRMKPIEDLIQQAQKGDLHAFDALVHRYQDRAVGYAYSILGDFHWAEDVAQEAFIQAFHDLPGLREAGAFGGWLRQLVFKHCDRLRRRGRVQTVPLEMAATVATGSEPAALVESSEARTEVFQWVSALPENERSVVLLYYIAEHSQQEIASFLQVTPNTIKKRLQSARGKLRQGMEESMKTTLSAAAPSRDDVLADKVQMINACKTGDAKTVRRLLKKNPELTEFDNPVGRFAPLHYAARAGHAAVVRELLKAGANPNPFEHMMRNHCGATTLEIARLRGYTEVVALLEDTIGQKHATGGAPAANTQIREALKKRDMPRVMELVTASPELVHATDDDGNTPLHRAAEVRPVNSGWLTTLLDSGADQEAVNFLGFKPVHLTLFRNHEWTSKKDDWRGTGFLLGRGATYNICLASAAGDITHVRSYLDVDKALANFQDTCLRRPLSCAAEFGHWKIAKLLLENGADPNATEAAPFRCYPLVMATKQNNIEMVQLLLEHGADPGAYVDAGGGALFHALENGYRDIADLLASHGASLSPADYAWRCDIPVLAALLKANPALAPELLEYNDESKPEKSIMVLKLAFKYGADPKKVGSWTLYRASDTPILLKAFLEHGVDPNASDAEGKTTLHAMNKHPNTECAGLLLDYGADIDARDDVHCATPLAWAAMFGNHDIVELLLSRGARPNLPDDEPWATPLFWAKHRGHKEIVKLLRKAGAKQ